MKWFVLILLASCTTSKQITLDASGTKVIGGDGKGRIVKWEWKTLKGESIIINQDEPVTAIEVTEGEYTWQLKVTDNLGQKDSAIYSITVR